MAPVFARRQTGGHGDDMGFMTLQCSQVIGWMTAALRERPVQTAPWLMMLTAGLAAAIFVLDLFAPLGVAVGMLYVVPVLLSSWSPRRQFTLTVAIASMALAVLGFLLSPLSGILWIAFANRSLALFLIWVTASLSLWHRQADVEKGELVRQLEDTLAHAKTLRGLLPICASCKKIRDDQGCWNYLESYIQAHSDAHFTHGLCPECQRQLYPTLYRKVG